MVVIFVVGAIEGAAVVRRIIVERFGSLERGVGVELDIVGGYFLVIVAAAAGALVDEIAVGGGGGDVGAAGAMMMLVVVGVSHYFLKTGAIEVRPWGRIGVC